MLDGPAFLCLFLSSERFPEDVSRAFDTILIGVCVQTESGALICVTQLLGNGGNICAVRYGHAGEAMTQLVRMHIFHSIAHGKLPHVVCVGLVGCMGSAEPSWVNTNLLMCFEA